MIQVTSATFDDGVFRPDNPLQLLPKARVRLLIEPLPPVSQAPSEKWTELEELWRCTSIDSGGEQLTSNFMNAVDTNVFVYSLDKHEPAKQQRARDLLHQLDIEPATTILLWQVIGEFIQRLRRWRDQGKLNDAEFQQHVAVYRKFFPLVLPTPAILDHALDLTAKYSLSHWDSMILGACLDAGVTTLYTEDMGAPRTIAGIQLINPFI